MIIENYFSYFSTKTYVVGAKKNRLNEMVLWSTQNMFKLTDKKIITILRSKTSVYGTFELIHNSLCVCLLEHVHLLG